MQEIKDMEKHAKMSLLNDSIGSNEFLPIKEYHLSKDRQTLIFALGGSLFLVALLPTIFIFLNESETLAEKALLFSVAMLTCLCAIYFIIGAKRIYIRISPEGIEYKTFGIKISTTWDNVLCIGKVPGGLIDTNNYGLILDQPAAGPSKWLPWTKRLLRFGNYDKMIPLFMFEANWQETDIVQDLRRYVPRIFSQSEDSRISSAIDEMCHADDLAKDIYSWWRPIAVFISLGIMFMAMSVHGLFAHDYNGPQLQHVSGELSDYSVIDVFRQHEVTFYLENESTPFIFKKVDWIPAIKKAIKEAEYVELWVDANAYHSGKLAEVWQIRIDGKMIVVRDDIAVELYKLTKEGIWIGVIFLSIGVGIALLKSKIGRNRRHQRAIEGYQ